MISALSKWMRRAGDFLFGFDFFISYAHGDGANYPQRLADMLQAKGFRVFLDSRVYVAGDDLGTATRRRIKMSKYLLILARPRALHSRWVLTELQRCLSAGGRPIAININETLEKGEDDNPLKKLLEDKIYIAETLENIDAEPTSRTIDDIVRSFKSTRQDAIRLRALIATGVVILAIAAFGGWQYMESRKQVFKAREETALRLAANAERQMFQNPQESLILAAQGAAASESGNAVQAAANAVVAALDVIRQRQEIQQDRNWGSNLFQSYIAGAWFEADLRARYGKGGELLLLSTERGASGNNPPGDAFLLDTKTLSMKKLDIGPAWGTANQGPGAIAAMTVKPGVTHAEIAFLCPAHPNAVGRLEIGQGGSDVKIVARDEAPHWSQKDKPRTFGRYFIQPGGQVAFEVESGRHALAFLDKDQAAAVLDFGESSYKFETKSRITSRSRTKRRLEFVGFGASENKIYLSRQYNVEVYSIDGAFQKEFKTGGGCTKYPVSYVTGVMDDRLIVYGDTDGGLYSLDFESGDCRYLRRGGGKILIKFDQSLSGKYAVLVFRDRTASIWKISRDDSKKNWIEVPNGKILSAWFSPRIDDQLLTSGEDGLVALWELGEKDLRQILTFPSTGESIEFSMFSDDGRSVVAVTESKNVLIWDSSTGESIGSIDSRAWEKKAREEQGPGGSS